MSRCGRRLGEVRFWLLRFEVRTEGEKRGPLAERSQGSAKAHPYIYGAHLCPSLFRFVYWGLGKFWAASWAVG